jgi:hypothetical protein
VFASPGSLDLGNVTYFITHDKGFHTEEQWNRLDYNKVTMASPVSDNKLYIITIIISTVAESDCGSTVAAVVVSRLCRFTASPLTTGKEFEHDNLKQLDLLRYIKNVWCRVWQRF